MGSAWVSLLGLRLVSGGGIADRRYIDAFIRDELSKGRYDPAITKVCFEMLLELFGRTLKLDLGEHDGKKLEIEDVC